MRIIISMIHQRPIPPNVIIFPTAIPIWPRGNRSTANKPRNIEYRSVEIK